MLIATTYDTPIKRSGLPLNLSLVRVSKLSLPENSEVPNPRATYQYEFRSIGCNQAGPSSSRSPEQINVLAAA